MRPEAPLLRVLAWALPWALTLPASAEGLDGRTVLMRAETWDDPRAPYLRSSDYVGRVGEGPEFGFAAEAQGGLFVVPVTIDLGPHGVSFSYEGTDGGAFFEAAFNGYVLTFPVECTLLAGARLDPAATTLPVTDADVSVAPQELRLDVAGLSYGPGDRIGLLLEVTDCALS